MSTKEVQKIIPETMGVTKEFVKAWVKGKEEKSFLFRVTGIIYEFIAGSRNGIEYTCIKGLFYAKGPDGVTVKSEALFLPNNVTDKLIKGFDGEAKKDQFTIDMYIIRDKRPINKSGFALVGQAPVPSDALARANALLESLDSGLPALEAPSKKKA